MSVMWTVIRKEFRETLRDWRTLLMMVVVPILLYPALMIVGQQLAIFGMRRVAAEPAAVAIRGEPDPFLVAFLDADPEIELRAGGDWDESHLRADAIDAIAIITDDAAGPWRVAILYDETDERSRRAESVLSRALEAWGDTLLAQRLDAYGLPRAFATPLLVADSSIARPEERGGYFLGRFLPLLLITITLMGAFYPAIDLAAGEKERGTLETLLTAPVPASRIVAGKFVTVATLGLVAAALNLFSMLMTFQVGLFELPERLEVTLPAGAIVIVFATLVPIAVLFAALFLGIAVRSHSFKEAQNALTPIYMAVLLPALLPLLPGIDFTPAMAVVPIAGVALMFRELMTGTATFLPSALAILATIAYAGAALAFAAAAFGREDVLFGTGERQERSRGGFREMFARVRAREGAGVPTPGQAILFVAMVAGLYFYGGIWLQSRHGERGLLASEWLLLLVPALVFIRVMGYDRRRTLSLRVPDASGWLGSVLLIAGAMPIAWFIAWLQSFVIELPDELVRTLQELVTAQDGRRLAWTILLVAVTPAICEEAVFRGVLLGGTRDRMPVPQMLALNAAVFGAFHLSIETVVRFLPTAWLGFVLAYAAWRTRSIYVSGLMHLLNNGALVLIASSPTAVAWLGGDEAAPPWWLFLVGVALLLAGFRLLGAPRVRPAAG